MGSGTGSNEVSFVGASSSGSAQASGGEQGPEVAQAAGSGSQVSGVALGSGVAQGSDVAEGASPQATGINVGASTSGGCAGCGP